MHAKLCSTCIYQVNKVKPTNKTVFKIETILFCLLTTTKHKLPCNNYIQGSNLYIKYLQVLNIEQIINEDKNKDRAALCSLAPELLTKAYNYT